MQILILTFSCLLLVVSFMVIDLSERCISELRYEKNLTHDEYYKKKIKLVIYQNTAGLSMIISLSGLLVWLLLL